jgi:hypothetical protein
VSSFENVNIIINEKYSKKHYDNPNYYVSFVTFQTCKNVILNSVHSFGWLFWLCFYHGLNSYGYIVHIDVAQS